MAKPTTDAPPTAARALEILEAPLRDQRAAEQAQAAAGLPDAQRTLRSAVAARLAEYGVIEAALSAWFQARPMVHQAQLESGLDERHREAIDRAVMTGRRLLERVTVAMAEAERVRAVLERPRDLATLAAEIKAVQQLDEQAPTLTAEHRRWQTVRAGVARELSASAAIATTQAAWMASAAGTAS